MNLYLGEWMWLLYQDTMHNSSEEIFFHILQTYPNLFKNLDEDGAQKI
jgi:hypothetical protein